ncbi:hypothetical protein HC928_26375 [bacterium]|nr:hypothetical protein [bacterium]
MTVIRYDIFQQKLRDYNREAGLALDEVEALAKFPSENAQTRPQRLKNTSNP